MAVALLTLGHALLQLPPWIPAFYTATVDSGYAAALQLIAKSPLQFGSEVAFTYGPYGYMTACGPTYHPKTFTVCIIGWLLFSLPLWLGAVRLARRNLPSTRFAPLLLVPWLATVIAVSAAGPVLDPFFFGLAALFLIAHFQAREAPSSPAMLLLAIALGWASLIKFTFLFASAGAIAIVTADHLWRRLRPWDEPVEDRTSKGGRGTRSTSRLLDAPVAFVASVLCLWFGAGQRFGSLGQFARSSLEISAGYSEAMSIAGPLREVAMFVLGSGLLLLVVLASSLRATRGARALLFPLGVAAILFLAFKAGFVRHDAHAVASGHTLLILSLLVLPGLFAEHVSPRASRVMAVLVLAAGVIPAWYLSVRHLRKGLPAHLGETLAALPDRSQAAWRLLTGRSEFPRLFEANKAELRSANPIPNASDTVDIYSSGQSLVLAHDLVYRPRPTFQSYTAYTPELLRGNAQHLRGERAPASILFRVEPIDNRFPALDDALSWPELLTRYDVEDASGPLLLLSRATPARRSLLKSTGKATTTFGAPLAVPPASEGPIWVTIDVRGRFLGKLVNTLFRSPVLTLHLTTEAGTSFSFRLIPGIARAGFLLSPIVEDNRGFTSLATGSWRERLAGGIVTSLEIRCEPAGPFGGARLFAPEIPVTFSRLEIEPQKARPRGEGEEMQLLEKLVGGLVASPFKPRLMTTPSGQTVAFAHAPTTLSLSVPEAINRITFEYGLLDGSWSGSGKTDGVEFRVSVESEGRTTPLLSRVLTPATSEADRGPQRASLSVELLKGSRVVFETRTGPSGDWDWAYWTGLKLSTGPAERAGAQR